LSALVVLGLALAQEQAAVQALVPVEVSELVLALVVAEVEVEVVQALVAVQAEAVPVEVVQVQAGELESVLAQE
jgi:hypothetical protein